MWSVECPHCNGRLAQSLNDDGPNFCPTCQKLFYVPEEPKMPSWILGVVVILVAHLQLLSH
jgi:uncharacterized Zn finger protein (UPF0148 family)